MSDEHDDWTADERRMLAALPRETAPPRRLEAAVVAALDARGLLGRRWRWPRLALAGAALVLPLAAAFVAGLALGERRARQADARPAVPAAPRFALLLYEGAGFEAGEAGAESRRVSEYASWARSLAAAGRFVEGEKLGSSGRMLDAAAAGASDAGGADEVERGEHGVLAGYFVISADDYGEAVRIARSCPHLKYGGTIAVRRIEET